MPEQGTQEAEQTQQNQSGSTSTDGHTFTQADVDRIIAERLSREKAKVPEDYEELKSKVAQFEESKKTESERLTGERDTFKSQAEQAQAEALRLRVALSKQLPAELIDRLRGSTKEELEADADELLKLVQPTQQRTGFGGGAGRETADQPPGINDWIRRTAGRL